MACNIFDDPWCGPQPGSNPGGIWRERNMVRNCPPLDPSIREYVLRVVKADEMRGELIGQALIFEAELNAWIDSIERKEVA